MYHFVVVGVDSKSLIRRQFFGGHGKRRDVRFFVSNITFVIEKHHTNSSDAPRPPDMGMQSRNISKYVKNREDARSRPCAHRRGAAAGPPGSGIVVGHRLAAPNPPGAASGPPDA